MPVNKSERKRKELPAEGLFGAEDDEVFQPATLDPTPEQIAMKTFLSAMAEPVPEAKRAAGGGQSVSLEGFVIDAKHTMGEGKGGKVPKRLLTIAVTNVMASGAKSVISPGVDGIHFLLPTKVVEPSPEDIAANKNARATSLLNVTYSNSKTAYLGIVTTSFFVDAGADKSDKNKGVESVCAGMSVIVNNVSATFGKNGGDALYINAKSVTPLTDVLLPGDAARAIIGECLSPRVMLPAAFVWSSVMGGFHGLSYSDPALQQQADSFKKKWAQMVEGSAAKVEALALSLGADEAMADNVAALAGHSVRIKDIKPEDASMGMPVFACEPPGKDVIGPFVAPLVQKGFTPASPNAGYFTSKLFDREERDKLPSSFCWAKIVKVESHANLCELMFRVFWVGDRAAAGASIASNPVLYSHRPSALVKVSKKVLSSEIFGTAVARKTEYLAKEVLPFTDMALHAHVFPRSPEDATLLGHFGRLNGLDIVSGIHNTGVLVSTTFLDEKMLSGRGVHIWKPLESETFVEPSPNAFTPSLTKHFYQALSETAFETDGLAVPDGKSLEIRVLYDGVSTNIANSPSIANEIEAGEAHIMDIAASLRDDGDVKQFLRSACTVYAIAV